MMASPDPPSGYHNSRRPNGSRMLRRALLALSAIGSLALAGPPALRAGDDLGAAVYREKCLSCHGDAGKGTKDYDKPLIGDRSIEQLTKYVAKRMPDDDPGSLSDEESRAVSAYIHDAFYSPIAQSRNQPPRIELTHLTARQYRNSVADLLATFRGDEVSLGVERGLRAQYFKERDFRRDNRVLERIDVNVNFDFGTATPVPGKTEPHEFSIRWEGALLAPDTGEYEIIIRTDHAARLWLNDERTPLIDAWVKSGNDTEYRGSITLLGGRAYPLKLEFSKAKQGVNDSDKEKKPPESKPAMVALEWKPPHAAQSPIPERCFAPISPPETFVLSSPFPPDDRSMGYERGASVSKEWDQATTEAALEVAGFVSKRFNALVGTRDDDGERMNKARTFAQRFVERAFRRPLDDAQKAFFIERQFEAAGDPALAIKRVILLVLKSPRFLFPEANASNDDFDRAGRLALALWDSLPDRDLLNAAAAGQLRTPDAVADQAERMLANPRARAKMRTFLLQWLKADPPPEVVKEGDVFPDFDLALFSDLRTSLELFLDDVVWNGDSDFRRLLVDDRVYLNGRLAAFFGVELPADAAFQPVRLDEGARAGVLTHPYVMTCLSYADTTSPIHRGVFLTRGVLGRMLRPPPDAFAPLAPDLHPSLTTRERVSLQTSPEACANCHAMINPLGFPLEQFDAVGRYRRDEKGKPIDAAGSYVTRSGETQQFEGARALAAFLADYDETHEAFVEQLFHNIAQQAVVAYGPDELERLRDAWRNDGYNLRKLMVRIATVAGMTGPESASDDE